jgi:hypothetical protein
VFDSGIGGLSVLQALRHELPHERFVYLADSGNAPTASAAMPLSSPAPAPWRLCGGITASRRW